MKKTKENNICIWFNNIKLIYNSDITCFSVGNNDYEFCQNLIMRRNYKSKFNELTPTGWIVLSGAVIIIILLVVVGIMIIRLYW